MNIFNKQKKGQAAMEFLMTYGWAILVVLAAIGALAYFGVFNTDRFIRESTISTPPLPNMDQAVIDSTTNQVLLVLKNEKGNKIEVQSASPSGTGDCGSATLTAQTMTVELNSTVFDIAGAGAANVSNGKMFTLTMTCANDFEAGRFKDDFKINYRDLTTGLTRDHTVLVTGRAQ